MVERAPGSGRAPAPSVRRRTRSSCTSSSPRTRAGFGLLPPPSPGDVFFDMEGDPLYEPAAGLEFLFGVLWREPDGSTAYRAVPGPRPGVRAARVRGVRRLRRRAAPRVPGHARLPLRGVRALDARPAHGHACDARGRDRRAAPQRGTRRPLPGRASGAARGRPVVLAEGDRAAVLHAHRRRRLGERGRDRVRALARRPTIRRGSTRSRHTTRRTARRRSGCATGCSTDSARRRREYERRDPVPPAARGQGADRPMSRRPTRRSRSFASGCSQRRSKATGRSSRAGCSSTTAARRDRHGGGTSAASR